MTTRVWTDMSDEAFDDAIRAEMNLLAMSNPAPSLRTSAPPRARPGWLPSRPPDRPRHLAPLGAAVAVAVVVTAGGAAWVGMHRLHGRAVEPAAPATPKPTFQASPVPTEPTGKATPTPPPWARPPAALVSTVHTTAPVFYYVTYSGQPPGALRLQAMDWSGAPQGHIDLPGSALPPDGSYSLGGPQQSPDGQRLLYGSAVYGSDGHHMYDFADSGNPKWADDGRHACSLAGKMNPATTGLVSWVVVYADGGAVERTVPLPHETGGDAGYYLEACSVLHDRLVVYTHVSSSTMEVTTLQISTGKVLIEQGTCGDVQCTTKGVMETVTTADAQISAEEAPGKPILIRSLQSGKLRALREQGAVIALSADGTRLLIGPGNPNYINAKVSTPLSLVDVTTDRVLWSTANTGEVMPGNVAMQPNSNVLAVAVPDHAPAPYSPGLSTKPPLPVPAHVVLLLGSGNALHPQSTTATDVYSLLEFLP